MSTLNSIRNQSHTYPLRYEGEYLNGKKHGKAKEYDVCDQLRFEGEYNHGKKIGKGKEYYEGQLIPGQTFYNLLY